jgi:hypothetical protein
MVLSEETHRAVALTLDVDDGDVPLRVSVDQNNCGIGWILLQLCD